MRKEAYDFIIAVNILTDNLEFMIEEEEFDIDRLRKRIEIVEKFKKELQKSLNNTFN